jgi:hypothetical protein
MVDIKRYHNRYFLQLWERQMMRAEAMETVETMRCEKSILMSVGWLW